MPAGPLTWRKKSLAFIVFSHSSGILPFSGEDRRNSCWLQPSSVRQYQIAGTEFAVAMSLNRCFAFRHFVLSGIAPPSGDECSTTQGHAESLTQISRAATRPFAGQYPTKEGNPSGCSEHAGSALASFSGLLADRSLIGTHFLLTDKATL